jgi:hypothetical protein
MRSPSTLLALSIENFKRNPKLFVQIYLILGGVLFITELFTPMVTDPLSFIVNLIFMTIVVAFAILTTIAMVRAVAAPETTTLEAAFNDAKAYAVPYFVLSFMVGVITLIGFFLFIIPGVIAMIWFAFAYLILLFEGKTGVEAMKASKAYVDGHFLEVLYRYLLIIVVGVVVGIATAVVGEALYGVSKVIPMLLVIVANAILMPIFISYLYFMYQDLRALKTVDGVAATSTPEAHASETTDSVVEAATEANPEVSRE